MEVATSLLYLDASLEDGDFDHPELGQRVQRLAQRIGDVRQGATPQPLEPWMEELYRRVSDRQTMGSVVQELRASLSEAEKQIDQYFRDPAQREVLIPVPGQLQAMRGVLSVLGMDQASQAVLRMRDDVDALASTEVDPQRAAQSRHLRPPGRQPGRAEFPDRHAQRAAADGQVAVRVTTPTTGSLRAGDGPARTAVGAWRASTSSSRRSRALVDQAQSLARAAAHRWPTTTVHAGARAACRSRRCWPTSAALARDDGAARRRCARASRRRQREAARDELAQAMAEPGAAAPADAAAPRGAGAAAPAPRRDGRAAPGSKKTTRCARSSSKKRAKCSTAPARRWPRWPTRPGDLAT